MTNFRTSTFHVGDIDLELETSDETFEPNTITRLLADTIKLPTSGRLLDLGCGVGVLAVFAALRGVPQVIAVDVMEQACELAARNAKRNGVSDRMQVRCGSLFSPVGDEMFDVIVNDVSGVADEVARLSAWYPDTIPTGGNDGADVIVPMLLASPAHLKPGGTLYFPTGTISNVARTLDAAHQAFGDNVELVTSKEVPFSKEFIQNIEKMQRLKEQNIIDFTQVRSRYLWTLQVYKAWL